TWFSERAPIRVSCSTTSRPACAATSTSSTRRSSSRVRTASVSSAPVIRDRLDAILDLWRLPRPRAYSPTAGGYQNVTRFVSCAAGEYVLRVYTNVADAAHQRFEHELLRRLASAGLSFEVPRPLRAPMAARCGSSTDGWRAASRGTAATR